MAVKFTDPEEVKGGRAGWQTLPAEVKPIDQLMGDFLEAFAEKGDGYSRKVEGFAYKPFEGENANKVPFPVRVAERVNKRAADEKIAVHARSINGFLHLVVGVKPEVKRAPRKTADAVATEAAPVEAVAASEGDTGAVAPAAA